jgi:heme-degrading monooxygenase HmoA
MQPLQVPPGRSAASPASGRRGFVCAWEYVVRPTCVAEFERIYGTDGEWARLFRKATGYRSTELHRDRTQPTRFLTLDFWDSREALDRFRKAFSAEYAALDAHCESLTEREREIGRFEPVDLD